jgi:hypothetical protein
MEENMDFYFEDEETLDQSVVDSFEDEQEVEYTDSEYETDEDSKDYVSRLLESRGIDRQRIQMVDEEGNVTEVRFDDLTDQDKFDILNYQEAPILPEDHEIDMINYLRQNNMSLQDFAEWQRQEAIKEYLSNQQQTSETDGYTDEEVIAYDFIRRFGEEMSDEEIDTEIERLKSDPEAFQKRVTLLRNSFKSEEEAQLRLYQDQEERRIKENEEIFTNTYYSALSNIDSIQNTELDDSDREELLHFVLDKDQANRTGLSKAMDNPENVLKMAWYLLHGEERVDAMIDYFQKEITKRSKSGPRAVSKTRQTVPTDDFKF